MHTLQGGGREGERKEENHVSPPTTPEAVSVTFNVYWMKTAQKEISNL